MLVFLDTEFTNLLCPQLLSVGMVTLDEREFYAEIVETRNRRHICRCLFALIPVRVR